MGTEKIAGKRTRLAERQAKEQELFQQVALLLQHLEQFLEKLNQELATITHAASPDSYTVTNEVGSLRKEFDALQGRALAVKPLIDAKLVELKKSHLSLSTNVMEASSVHMIQMMHLVGEVSISKRQEEMVAIQKARQEHVAKLQQALKTLKERFEELAHKLNILIFMRDCLQKEGALPANIMYNFKIPQVVSSPFTSMQFIQKQLHQFPAQGPSTDSSLALKEEIEKRRQQLLMLRKKARSQS